MKKRPWNKGLTKETDKRVAKIAKTWLGKKHTESAKQKMRKAHKGRIITSEWRKKIGQANIRLGKKPPSALGIKRSDDFKLRCSLAQKGRKGRSLTILEKKHLSDYWKGKRLGKNNPCWKGGKTKLQDLIRSSNRYQQWRSEVFKRDNFICQKCKAKTGFVEAHHKKPFYILLDIYNIKSLKDALNCKPLWDIANGKTLCKECHDRTKKGSRKIRRIYIAGKYSDSSLIQALDNIRNGINAGNKIAISGYAPYIPFLDFQQRILDSRVTLEMYYKASMAWLEVSDAVFVLPYSEHSKGTQMEIQKAIEFEIPIFYDLKEIKKIFK